MCGALGGRRLSARRSRLGNRRARPRARNHSRVQQSDAPGADGRTRRAQRVTERDRAQFESQQRDAHRRPDACGSSYRDGGRGDVLRAKRAQLRTRRRRHRRHAFGRLPRRLAARANAAPRIDSRRPRVRTPYEERCHRALDAVRRVDAGRRRTASSLPSSVREPSRARSLRHRAGSRHRHCYSMRSRVSVWRRSPLRRNATLPASRPRFLRRASLIRSIRRVRTRSCNSRRRASCKVSSLDFTTMCCSRRAQSVRSWPDGCASETPLGHS